MSKIIGLFELTFALAFRGDGPGARASGIATIEAGSECPGLFERQIHSAVGVACLADGDTAAAREAALATERTDIVIPGVDDLHMVWAAQVALACGDLAIRPLQSRHRGVRIQEVLVGDGALDTRVRLGCTKRI